MISTCSYKNFNSNLASTIAISGDHGKQANYNGRYFRELAPKLSFWEKWHDNIGVIPEEENTKYYIEQYYKEVLSKLNPEIIFDKLNYNILLCYEDNTEFCHRHVVAEWLQILLEEEIPEIKIEGYKVEKLERPAYIREYLEEIMRKDRNMRGFNSLRALYLFEKGEALEQKASLLEDKNSDKYFHYMQSACYYRCDADMAEEEYNQRKKKLIKK